MTSSAIEADHLVKDFGDVRAVDDVSFSVPQGTVLGLLGPNGAGKTTTVRMMTTLTTLTSGRAGERASDGRRPRRGQPARRRPAQHGPHGAGGDRRRAAHRPGEPPADR